jgi:redox-sensitive bicupin YhaK (pirin superfamily)
MIAVRQSKDRGHQNYGWLDTYHTFSFADYYDPAQMGFRSLRVMNEDRVAPGMGFGMHGHRDMEIVTYVLSGALEHKDSLGHGEVLRPGELQRMTAGRGIRHSEFNPSADQPVHLYQIWLLPRETGLEPSYEQKAYPAAERHNRLRLVASPAGDDGALTIQQDARLYLATLDADTSVVHELPAGRHAWLQVLRGSVELNGTPLSTSDGAAIKSESQLTIKATAPAEILLFDLA